MKRRIMFGVFCLWLIFVSCSCLPNDESIYFEKKEGDSRGLVFTYDKYGMYGIDPEKMEIRWIIRGRNSHPCYPVKSDDGRVFFVPSRFERGAPPNDTIVVLNKEGRIIKKFSPPQWQGKTIMDLDIFENFLIALSVSSQIGIIDTATYELRATYRSETFLYQGDVLKGDNFLLFIGYQSAQKILLTDFTTLTTTAYHTYGLQDGYALWSNYLYGISSSSIYVWDIENEILYTNFHITNYLPEYVSEISNLYSGRIYVCNDMVGFDFYVNDYIGFVLFDPQTFSLKRKIDLNTLLPYLPSYKRIPLFPVFTSTNKIGLTFYPEYGRSAFFTINCETGEVSKLLFMPKERNISRTGQSLR